MDLSGNQPVTPPPPPPVPAGPNSLHDHEMGHDYSFLRIPLMVGAVVILGLALFGIYKYSQMPKSNSPDVATVPTAFPTSSITTAPLPTTDPFAGLEREGSQSATLGADLPPLYSGIQWEEIKIGEIIVHNEKLDVLVIPGNSVLSKELSTYPLEFVEYYKSYFSSSGSNWILIAESGFPEGDGGFYEYKKGDKFFMFGVRKNADDGPIGKALIQYN